MRVTKSILIERALIGVFWVLGTMGFICDELIRGWSRCVPISCWPVMPSWCCWD